MGKLVTKKEVNLQILKTHDLKNQQATFHFISNHGGRVRKEKEDMAAAARGTGTLMCYCEHYTG